MVSASILIAWGVAAAASPQPELTFRPELTPGRPFPDLRLESLEDGRIRSVSELLGKRTLLVVFASW